MAIVPWIVAALSAMGVALGYFASRGTPPGKDPRCGGSN
jgi:hypothetical protein